MRRVRVIAAVAAVMATILILVQGPAMADDVNFDGIDDGLIFVDDGFGGFFCEDFDFDGFCDSDNGLGFVDGVNFGGGVNFGVQQETGDTGDVTITNTIT
jgi:hypothetical protein